MENCEVLFCTKNEIFDVTVLIIEISNQYFSARYLFSIIENIHKITLYLTAVSNVASFKKTIIKTEKDFILIHKIDQILKRNNTESRMK